MRVAPIGRAVNVGREPLDERRLSEEATVVVFNVVVVLVVVLVVEGEVLPEGMTRPDGGSVISPMGLMIVGPTGVLRGRKIMPAVPAAMRSNEATVHQSKVGRCLGDGDSVLKVLEPRSNSLLS